MEVCVLLSALLCVHTALGSPISTAAQGFLERFGYLKKNETHRPAEVTSALREFQRFSGLPVSGRLDSETLEKMKTPRCGVKDADSISTGHQQRLRRTTHTHTGERWARRHLSYRVVNGPRSLSPAQVQVAVRTAFQLWSNVSGLDFQELRHGPADIRIAFFEGEHNDGTGNAFDGPGGALAHAFFPVRGEAHFDKSERWTLSGAKGHHLFPVTAHEIGHTLGLPHSPVRHALMYPYYKRMSSASLLSWDDITTVQQLYGKPAGGAVTPLTGRALRRVLHDGTVPHESLIPHYCHEGFDAITTDPDGTVLVIQGHHFWTVCNGSVSGPFHLHSRWPRLSMPIDSAALCPLDRKLYFFKGRRMWRYSGSDLDAGFPRRSVDLGLPRRPDCAVFFQPLGHMLIFKESRYFVLNLHSLSPELYYPRPLKDWRGVPRATNGALTRPDGTLYFFKELQYWRFDPGKVRVTESGRWNETLSWMGCQKRETT